MPFRLKQCPKSQKNMNSCPLGLLLTSNHHTENIIFNAIVRMQGKEKLKGDKSIST